MFRQVIDRTPLTDRGANFLFDSKIPVRDAYSGDVSFIATLRALVFSKLGEDEAITLRNFSIRQSYLSTEGHSVRSKLNEFGWNYNAEDTGERGYICICNFSHRNEDNNQGWMDFLRDHFAKEYTDYEQLPMVTDFFKKAFNTICFIDRKHKNVAIFVSNLDIRIWHYLQAAIPAFLPWYFEDGVTDEELELLQSLRLKKPDKYLETLRNIAQNFDFKTEAIKNMLRGFESKYERAELEAKRRDITNYITNITRLNNDISNCLKAKAEAEIVCMGLEKKIADSDGESEIMDYFLTNKNLTLENVTDSEMYFAVKGYIEYYDDDLAETVISNTNSSIYREVHCGRRDANLLFKAIFIDHRFRLRTCAAYSFDLRGNVRTLGGHNFDSDYENNFPNTHIQDYNCMGNYTRVINEMLVNHDYIGAIEQCAASCKSLNFADSIVIERFGGNITGAYADQKVLEAPDGTLLSPREATRMLVEEFTGENKEETTEMSDEIPDEDVVDVEI